MGKLKENDEFGNRMKEYEAVETSRRFDLDKPIYARIDGRSFSKFTRGMNRPFDTDMSNAMVEVVKYLVQETDARIGYTQSDEISLVWLRRSENSSIFFAGKIMKMSSVLASMAAAKFARVCPKGFEDRLPHFDCRVFELPNKSEAANAFLWRAMDARKNAISMAAQAHFSHRSLQGKIQKEMLEMLAEKGINFDEYPGFFKNGTFARRKTVLRSLTPEELAAIPSDFRPTGPVYRTDIETISDVYLRDVEDRVSFVFDNA